MADRRTWRRIEWAALGGVLLLAALLRLARLEDNGFGTVYYAAGVRSMLQGAWLFFYNAFDPAGFVSLDKPPVAFWIQAAFAGVLGYGGWELHLPQALAGIAAVALLYALVRPAGARAAIVAALLLAISPISVAIDRSNNADSWLILFLLLAAALALRGRGLSLVAAMAVLALAFNTKMLAALVGGPALLAAWLLATDLSWRQRLAWMAGAGAVLVVLSLAWAVAFDLTPADSRPYAGSSHGNSMLELIVGHNGLERFRPPANPTTAPLTAQSAAPTGRVRQVEAYDAVPVGPLRLAHPTLATQFAWALPLAAAGVLLGWRRRPALVALWGVWAVTYAAVYSLAGGIFHAYYLATLAPPLAALAGIGAADLWRRGTALLAAGIAATATLQAAVAGASLGWESVWMGFPAIALLGAAAAAVRRRRPAAAIGGAALLVLPLAWALSALFSPGNLTLPSASLPRWLGRDDGRGPLLSRTYSALTDDPRLQAYLKEHRGRARFLLATPDALLAAPVIVRTGQPVMAFGGFLGRDPVISVEAFAEAVHRGEVRFAVLAANRRTRAFERWVRAHGKPVDPALWRSLPADPRRELTLYDLRPG
ncbi:glycosyltransferase family 39 protein [Reyranella sp.]|uniref:glycosyltransferase family 39 protein n=1 Tax=Reyranella sp. TaxID=1929291 RepID=UPI003BADABCB